MAHNLIISYDLNRPGQTYDEVEKRIKELGSAIKLLETVWFVSSQYSATVTRDHVRQSTDKNDSVVVIDAKRNDYSVYLGEKERNFLAKHWNH